MPPTFSRICLFLSHSADENAAQDDQRFSFGGFAQGHIEEFDSNSIRCEGLVLGVAVVHAITIDLSLCCWTCSNNAMSFASQAFSIRDERVISAGLACEWYIVLAMDETKSKHKEGQAPGTAPESDNPLQPKGVLARIKAPLNAAFPVMIGYVFLGIPCGILAQQIGLDPLQVFLLSMLFYSGAGQYMIPNMWLAGAPIASIIASVSFVNTRQMLYSAAFAPHCIGVRKRLAFPFAATVTDESYGVNTLKFEVHLLDALVHGRRAGGQRHRHPARDRLLRHDLDLHLPSVHAESECGKRGCRCGRDARRLRVQAGGAHRPRDPSRRGSGRCCRLVRVPGASCTLARECGVRGSHRGGVRRRGRR